MNDPLPEGWNDVVLGDHAYIKARIGWRGLSSSEYTEKGPYLIAGKHLIGSRIDWANCDHISEYRYEESKEIQLQELDVIISKDGTIGRLGFVENMPSKATINGTMMLIRPSDKFSSKFIYFYLQGNKFQKIVQEKVSGSSVPHIFQRDMVTLNVPHPPLPEQKKIAAILTSVDTVIEKTQAQINKLKDLKTGMMQELLTKGIGHTEFKDSPVGRIPVEWEVAEIGEVAEQVKPGPFGSSLTKSMYVKSGFKVYGQEQVISGDLSVGNYYINQEKYDELSAFKVQAGEILISLVGTFGQVAIVPEQFKPGVINPRLLKLRFPKNSIIPDFIAYQLRSEFVLNQLKQFQQGGTMGVLSATTVKPVKLIIPPVNAQIQIANAISSIDEMIDVNKHKLASIKYAKKSLMQDLLTGKVRVKV